VHAEPSADLDRLIAAVQNPTRRGILVALLHDRRPHTVDEVAELARVHRTVAFNHLERLVDLGLLVRDRRRGLLGKPAGLYTAAGTSLNAAVPQRQFAQLARLLAEGLVGLGRRGRTAARVAGRRYGESLAGPPACSVSDALSRLQPLGGDYQMADGRVIARNCVFFEACLSASEVVCGLHAALLEGALHAAGISAIVEPGGKLPPGGCSYLVTGRLSEP
jgi:predicted ArsR family transcriptional regulator